MPELEGWVKAIEDKVRSCAAGHSGFQIWRLLRMLKVKVEEPKRRKSRRRIMINALQKIETELTCDAVAKRYEVAPKNRTSG